MIGKDTDRSKSISDMNLTSIASAWHATEVEKGGTMSWTSVHRAALEDPREALEAAGKEILHWLVLTQAEFKIQA